MADRLATLQKSTASSPPGAPAPREPEGAENFFFDLETTNPGIDFDLWVSL
jgi:hypothetical protein